MNTRETIAAQTKQLKQLHGRQKIQYIWDYFKFLIVVCLILLYIIGYIIYGHFSKKDTVLYTALVNVSVDEQMNTRLSDGFMDFIDADTSKNDIQLYTGLYLTGNQDDPNHEYTYASRIKIIASVDDEKLDIVLMNREAFDAFTQNEYLCNLEELPWDSDSALPAELKLHPTGLDVSQKGLFKEAGFEDPVYLGVIANSPRMDMVVNYINYLCQLGTGYF